MNPSKLQYLTSEIENILRNEPSSNEWSSSSVLVSKMIAVIGSAWILKGAISKFSLQNVANHCQLLLDCISTKSSPLA